MKADRRKYELLFCLVGVAVLIVFSVRDVVAQVNEGLTLENDYVRFVFEAKTGGLSGMTDKKAGIPHIRKTGKGELLWELALSPGSQRETITNLDNPATLMKIEMLPDGTQRGILEWAFMEWWREKGVLTVRVTVDLPKDSGIASWRITVENASDLWGLWTVKFPYVRGFPAAGEYDVAVPESNWGMLYRGAREELGSWYPEWTWPAQFLIASKGASSVYMANNDPDGWMKKYSLKPGEEFYFEHYPENMAIAGSDFPGPYAVSFGIYEGDWFQGCKIYRSWALANAPWTKEGPLSSRKSVPESIRNLGLWMLGGWEYGSSDLTELLIKARDYFGAPIGYHWYNWHGMAFDNNYPHFFPAKEGFEARARALAQGGILTMPYINGWAVDDKIPDFTRFYAATVKTQPGTPFARIFGENSGRLTVMCPSAPLWRRTVDELVDRLANSGLNAVYIDCIASVPPTLCFDRLHGHPAGGGTWWVNGYRQLLAEVQETAHRDGRDIVITSECNEEVYMDGVDGFLVWIKRDEKEIPMMPAVYSGYTIYFASPHDLAATDRSFVMCQGRDFLWGCQNGWMGFDLLESRHVAKAEYLKKIGKYRVAGKKYLTYGELAGIVKPQNTVPTATEIWKNQGGQEENATIPGAMGTIWKSEDGSLAVFMANFLDSETTLAYSFNPGDYGMKSRGGYRVMNVTPEGSYEEAKVSAGRFERTDHLGAREIRIIEIAAE